MTQPPLLAVPNVSEGRDARLIERLAGAFASHGARLLDVHSDADHNRSVFTLAGEPGRLARAVAAGTREAVARLDLAHHQGVHPRVGVVDVAPIVYLEATQVGAACAEALVLADLLGEDVRLPVFLYGALGGGRTRAELRRGGPGAVARRMAAGELEPDFGPPEPHPTAGVVLVAARAPLIAFNVELGPMATLEDARAIAAEIREGGPDGLTGVRALGLWLEQRERAQLSMNLEDPVATPPATAVAAIARRAAVAEAELVGLAPRAALQGLPADLRVRGLRTIEDALRGTAEG
ncbi:MAG TPA: glutamate formiminotransferase [Candidatus Limnocylindria bacterium]|nr:glutamate formiminotransferase [Candidatus Limnocylindria bacterium]